MLKILSSFVLDGGSQCQADFVRRVLCHRGQLGGELQIKLFIAGQDFFAPEITELFQQVGGHCGTDIFRGVAQ
jgi:hypothetical protein